MHKLALFCVGLMLLATPTLGQVGHGSLVVYIVSIKGDYVVIGSESRELSGRGNTHVNDECCKIIVLGGETLFYSTGSSSVKNGEIDLWNSMKAARSVYSASEQRGAQKLSDEWSKQALEKFWPLSAKARKSLVQTPEGDVVTGGFINFDSSGRLSVHNQNVMYDAELINCL
jgi:hypothetical protein